MNCRFCAEPAGFLKREHRECVERRDSAKERGPHLIAEGACAGRVWSQIEPKVEALIRDNFLHDRDLDGFVEKGLEAAQEKVLDDDLLDEEEERRVLGFIHSLPESFADNRTVEQVVERLGQAGVLRVVLDGKNPFELQHRGPLRGFRFMKSETPVWAFDDVDYEILKTRVQYSGGSQGMSFRVAKGVYVRTGGFRGERYTTEERHHVDCGRVVITTKHVYFAGESHRFRIRHDRVVSYEPLPDGFEVTRDRANARPERFHGMDGWFAYNLLMNAEDLT